MRTTVDITDALLRELRELAAESGRPFRVVLEEVIARGLAATEENSKPQRVRVKPHRLGLKPGFTGISLNQLYDQVEAEATARTP